MQSDVTFLMSPNLKIYGNRAKVCKNGDEHLSSQGDVAILTPFVHLFEILCICWILIADGCLPSSVIYSTSQKNTIVTRKQEEDLGQCGSWSSPLLENKSLHIIYSVNYIYLNHSYILKYYCVFLWLFMQILKYCFTMADIEGLCHKSLPLVTWPARHGPIYHMTLL